VTNKIIIKGKGVNVEIEMDEDFQNSIQLDENGEGIASVPAIEQAVDLARFTAKTMAGGHMLAEAAAIPGAVAVNGLAPTPATTGSGATDFNGNPLPDVMYCTEAWINAKAHDCSKTDLGAFQLCPGGVELRLRAPQYREGKTAKEYYHPLPQAFDGLDVPGGEIKNHNSFRSKATVKPSAGAEVALRQTTQAAPDPLPEEAEQGTIDPSELPF
jgi:hypothetical protein